LIRVSIIWGVTAIRYDFSNWCLKVLFLKLVYLLCTYA
jgi:hypothetical protein